MLIYLAFYDHNDLRHVRTIKKPCFYAGTKSLKKKVPLISKHVNLSTKIRHLITRIDRNELRNHGIKVRNDLRKI